MAKRNGVPQLEDGFARIANEALEAMAKTSFTDHESRCLHFLLRKTYGWQNPDGTSKKYDRISYGQWAGGTNIPRRHIPRVLERLVMRNIITKIVTHNGRSTILVWGFQKRYKDWLTPLFEPIYEEDDNIQLQGVPQPGDKPSVGVPPHGDSSYSGVPQPGDGVSPSEGTPFEREVSPSEGTTKDIYKDTIQKIYSNYSEILEILWGLPNWPKKADEDALWLEGFIKDFPAAAAAHFKACRDYHSERPAKDKGAWKNRFRQWMHHDLDYKAKNGAVTARGNKPIRRRPGKVPTEKELEQQAREKGVLA